MTLLNLRTKNITISRLSAVSGDKIDFATTVTTDSVNIQPASIKKSLDVTGAVGKLYKMYGDVNINIQDGDRIVDEDGREYNVIAGGVNDNYDFGVMVQHTEIMVERVTND